MTLQDQILTLYPQAVPLGDFFIQDNGDGNGPFLARWNKRLGPIPTDAALAAVTQAQVDAAKAAALRADATALLNHPGATGTLLRAIVKAANLNLAQVINQL